MTFLILGGVLIVERYNACPNRQMDTYSPFPTSCPPLPNTIPDIGWPPRHVSTASIPPAAVSLAQTTRACYNMFTGNGLHSAVN